MECFKCSVISTNFCFSCETRWCYKCSKQFSFCDKCGDSRAFLKEKEQISDTISNTKEDETKKEPSWDKLWNFFDFVVELVKSDASKYEFEQKIRHKYNMVKMGDIYFATLNHFLLLREITEMSVDSRLAFYQLINKLWNFIFYQYQHTRVDACTFNYQQRLMEAIISYSNYKIIKPLIEDLDDVLTGSKHKLNLVGVVLWVCFDDARAAAVWAIERTGIEEN